MTAHATAPGSSANLGPGFDCLALALELRCRVEAEASDEWLLDEYDTVVPLPAGDMVRRAVEAAVGRPMRLTIRNEVPRTRGLGSSSAVTAAAAAAAMRAVGEEPSSTRLFEIVTALEGHGDNAAAATYGGLVVVAGGRIRHLTLAPELRVVVGIPDHHLSTRQAREALPHAVRLSAAARSVARMAFLVEGLRTGDPETLAAAAGDELHESLRASLSPVTGEMMAAARGAGALHAAWSGAGPSAIAFVTDDSRDAVMAAMAEVVGDTGEVRVLPVAAEGWT